jgi:hypothetical protein
MLFMLFMLFRVRGVGKKFECLKAFEGLTGVGATAGFLWSVVKCRRLVASSP